MHNFETAFFSPANFLGLVFWLFLHSSNMQIDVDAE